MMTDRDAVAIIDAASSEDSSAVDNEDTDAESNARKRFILRSSLLEIVMFLLCFAWNFEGTVFKNQVLFETCRVEFNHSNTECESFMGVAPETEESRKLELIVQPYAANIFMTNTLIECLVSSFLVLFLGPWSDRFGRKPIIIGIFAGYLVAYSLITLVALISLKYQINPWIYLWICAPIYLTGGFCGIITITYCYISDIVTETKSRARRMLLLEISIFGGISTGSFLSTYVYESTNAVTVFAISSVTVFIGLLLIIFVLPESLSEVDGGSSSSKIKEFFKWELAKDLLRTVVEKRPNYDRAIIWLVMLAIGFSVASMQDSNLMYLFVREKFEWGIKEFNIFVTVAVIYQVACSIIVIALIVPLFRRIMKFSLPAMCLLGFGSAFLEPLIRGLAVYPYHLYLGVAFALFKGIPGPMCRAIISQISSPSEIGKIFAFTTSLETIFPLITAPIYTLIYNSTLSYMPGAFNFLSAGLNLMCYLFMAAVFGIQMVYPMNGTYDVIS